MKLIISIFLIFLFFHIIIAYNLPGFIPVSPFPYDDLLRKYFQLYPFTAYANFDGYQYISIAKIGYAQLQQSYFPLFPAVIAVLSPLFLKNYILSGMFVSWVCFFGGLFYFKKYVDVLLHNPSQTKWAIFFLITFPTAFFYQIIYPESLFLFLSTASLYFLIKRNYVLATIFVFFASLTKIQGVLLEIPFVLTVFEVNLFDYKKISFTKILLFSKQKYKLLFFALAPIYGLLDYSIYLYIHYRDPLYYYHAQSAFGAHRSTDKLVLLPQVLYRYIKIFYTSQMNFAYWVAWFEFITFIFIAGVLIYDLIILLRKKEKDLQQLSLNLYSLAVMILPTLTGTLTSYPRYALLSLGFFTAMAKIPNKIVKISVIGIFSAMQIVVNIYFLKGYFIS